MTKDEIIRMAVESNFYPSEVGNAEDCFVHFANLVAAAEREACAKACEECAKRCEDEPTNDRERALECAATIRARSQS
jgi:predicted sulfurtransferase